MMFGRVAPDFDAPDFDAVDLAGVGLAAVALDAVDFDAVDFDAVELAGMDASLEGASGAASVSGFEPSWFRCEDDGSDGCGDGGGVSWPNNRAVPPNIPRGTPLGLPLSLSSSVPHTPQASTANATSREVIGENDRGESGRIAAVSFPVTGRREVSSLSSRIHGSLFHFQSGLSLAVRRVL
jgi:hypothetical protein